jgi:tRNA pseudouridine38/39 synthase
MQRNIALKVSYMGDSYNGLARQTHCNNTVEHHIFAALQKLRLIDERSYNHHYTRCGRTDKGVSAHSQVLSFHLRSNLKEGVTFTSDMRPSSYTSRRKDDSDDDGEVREGQEGDVVDTVPWLSSSHDDEFNDREISYDQVINKQLPPSIRVLAWSPVSNTFNARHDCLYRTYRYYFAADGLNISDMIRGAEMLKGTHDFRNFCKIDILSVRSFVREIQHIEFIQCPADPSVYIFEVRGSSFLYHQVRCIMGILFEIGQGREEPSLVRDLLNTSMVTRKPIYDLAPPESLILYDCGFPDGVFSWRSSRGSRLSTVDHYATMYKRKKEEAARYFNVMTNTAAYDTDKVFREIPPPIYVPILNRLTCNTYEEK